MAGRTPSGLTRYCRHTRCLSGSSAYQASKGAANKNACRASSYGADSRPHHCANHHEAGHHG